MSAFTARSSRPPPSCTWRRPWRSISWLMLSAVHSAKDPTTTRATTTWSTTQTFSRPSQVGAVHELGTQLGSGGSPKRANSTPGFTRRACAVSGGRRLPAISTGGDAQESPEFQGDVEKEERGQQRVTRTQGWQAEGGRCLSRERRGPTTEHTEETPHPQGFLPRKSWQQPCREQRVGVGTPQGAVPQPLGDRQQ